MNEQRPEKQAEHSVYYDVIDVWYTIQGEGPHAGAPAVFIRLAGCNLRCHLCDTNYTNGRYRATSAEIMARVRTVAGPRCRFVVITGGEPFRQNLFNLTADLHAAGFGVQVETNGTLPFNAHHTTQVVISPKTNFIDQSFVTRGTVIAYKYVVATGYVDDDGFPNVVLGNPVRVARPLTLDVPVYLQPLDEDPVRNGHHIRTAVELCQKHNRFLCLQIHKLVGLK